MAIEDFWDKTADAILSVAFSDGSLFFVGVLGWQLLHWQQTSEWQPLPFHVALSYIGISTESVYAPQSWFGLAKAAQFFLELPMSVMVPACGLLLGFAWMAFVSSGTAK